MDIRILLFTSPLFFLTGTTVFNRKVRMPFRNFSLILDNIPHSTNRTDNMNSEPVVNLLPQIANIYIYNIGIPKIIIIPHIIQKLLPCQRNIPIAQQIFQQLIFLLRQRKLNLTVICAVARTQGCSGKNSAQKLSLGRWSFHRPGGIKCSTTR